MRKSLFGYRRARRKNAGQVRKTVRRCKVGTFYVSCVVSSHTDRAKATRIPKILVDTGSEYTWISGPVLRKIGIQAEKKDVSFVMANGKTITRRVGFAIVRVEGIITTDEIVFAEEGDLQLLGARSLEGLNLRFDPVSKLLVDAGPVPAAAVSLAMAS